MNYIQVKDPKTYYGYGDINSEIFADCFSWDEREEFNINNDIINFLNKHIKNRKLYFFTMMRLFHPINFKDKHYGLWRKYNIDHQLNLFDYTEVQIELKRYLQFYGISKIVKNELSDLLGNTLKDSFIVFSDYEIDLSQCKSGLIISNNDCKIDYAYLINHFCQSGDVFVTKIDGVDGTTLNMFYSTESTA